MKHTSATSKNIDLVGQVLDDVAMLVGDFQVLPCQLSNGEKVVPGLGMTTDATALKRRANDIQQGLFSILVTGKFKHGKSTLINALLGKETVRARSIPTTAVITVISQGTNAKVSVYEHGQTKPKVISWEIFQRDFSLSADDINSTEASRFLKYDYAEIETQHPLVTKGVKLIDSPGLGEDESRSATTLRFIKQAQAVIMVLDANRLLDEKEREFIKDYLGAGRLDHVFFVVNRINQIEAGEVADLHARIRKILKVHFTDTNGLFDKEYFERRVFFVDAKGALDARNQNGKNSDKLNASGILQLEHEIDAVLNSEERLRAVMTSSLQTLIGITQEANHQIELRKIAFQQPLMELQHRQKEASKQLKELSQRKKQISGRIISSGKHIALKAEKQYQVFIGLLEKKWSTDSARIIPLASIGFVDLSSCAFSEEAKKKVVNIIQSEVSTYMRDSLKRFSEETEKLLKGDMKETQTEIQVSINEFLEQINQTQSQFAAGRALTPFKAERLNLTFHDTFNSNLARGTNDWNAIIQTSLMELLLVLGVWILAMYNPLVLLGAIAASFAGWSIASPGKVVENFKDKLRKKIGDDLHTRLKTDSGLINTLKANIDSYFNQYANQVDDTLDGRIGDASHQIQNILTDLNNQNFSITNESARLDIIYEQLQSALNTISIAATGRPFDGQQLTKLKK